MGPAHVNEAIPRSGRLWLLLNPSWLSFLSGVFVSAAVNLLTAQVGGGAPNNVGVVIRAALLLGISGAAAYGLSTALDALRQTWAVAENHPAAWPGVIREQQVRLVLLLLPLLLAAVLAFLMLLAVATQVPPT